MSNYEKYDLTQEEINLLHRDLIDTRDVIALFDHHFRSCSESTFYAVFRPQLQCKPYGSRETAGRGRSARLYDKGEVLKEIARIKRVRRRQRADYKKP